MAEPSAKLLFLITVLLTVTHIHCYSTRAWGKRPSKEIVKLSRMSFEDIVRHYGYQIETETVPTKSGYLQPLYHMPMRNECPGNQLPVFLMHGTQVGPTDWIIQGPGKSLAFRLVDECFDVWIGEGRGFHFLKRKPHKRYSVLNPKFWRFYMENMALEDLPAYIEHILSKTGNPKLFYVGHSQGSDEYLILDSMRPEFTERTVKFATLLAPAVFSKGVTSPAITQLKYVAYAKNLMHAFGFYVMDERLTPVGLAETLICRTRFASVAKFCSLKVFTIGGYDKPTFNTSLIPLMMKHYQYPLSTMQLSHMGQLYLSGRFQRFDYGPLKNLFKYGRLKAPAYPLENARSTYAIFDGANDILAPPEGVNILLERLPKIPQSYVPSWDLFTHQDFVYSSDINKLVNDQILTNLKSGYPKKNPSMRERVPVHTRPLGTRFRCPKFMPRFMDRFFGKLMCYRLPKD